MSRIVDFLTAGWETPAEKARREGELEYDQRRGEFVEDDE